MSKYICPECRKVTDELPFRTRKIRENFGIGRFTVAEDHEELTCKCGNYYVDAYPCECCGEFFTEDELNREGLCAECEREEAISA